jgi:serine protease Do
VPRGTAEQFGLSERRGAMVSSVRPGEPADKAGLEPGDVIVEVNGQRVGDSEDLVQRIVSLKPGTTVPVKVLRDRQEKTLNVTIGELNLEAEEGQEARAGEEEDGTGFGMALGALTAERARRLGLPAGTTGVVITDVDPDGSAARSGLQPGDVVLQINRQDVSSPAEARRLLQEVEAGGTAFLLVQRQGRERFIPLRKQ